MTLNIRIVIILGINVECCSSRIRRCTPPFFFEVLPVFRLIGSDDTGKLITHSILKLKLLYGRLN